MREKQRTANIFYTVLTVIVRLRGSALNIFTFICRYHAYNIWNDHSKGAIFLEVLFSFVDTCTRMATQCTRIRADVESQP